MSKLRVVLDTNILISGLLFSPSTPQQVFDGVIAKENILISDDTFQELSQTLIRQKFDKYLSLEKRVKFISNLTKKAVIVNITEIVNICRDPKDHKFLDLAISGNATHLVTGDKDLLELSAVRNTLIITPSQFLAVVGWVK
ncbi:putative toxin-antitoxin system toxin component, PIN family [Crocosphaera watsonii]|uniref:PIN domain-containing protein n=1 Tax=Crocosphaera watsonii WH 0401 TaxID=555881 RepID=T2J5J2_CROWT|nr:putative toxin-antitoxin system toxin component, PIN family [Crocosphaera watsonii]CCQ60475.1 hypothetical protein CWATWH0401_2280 [Crocosphaera watsonii WH 0401]